MRLQFALVAGAALGVAAWSYGKSDRDELETFVSRIPRVSHRAIQAGPFP